MLKLTEHKKGLKMEGFLSLNTSTSCNPFCKKMSENKTCICSQCYGKYMERRYPRAKNAWIENFNILTSRLLSTDEIIPIINKINKKRKLSGVRFHSVGELFNDTHFTNFFKIIGKINIDIPVTIWSKRLEFFNKVSESYIKSSCNVIHSNPIFNSYLNPADDPDYILHTFNVYDSAEKMHEDIKQAVKNGIDIAECSGKCKECMICYPKQGIEMTRFAVFELTKKAQGIT